MEMRIESKREYEKSEKFFKGLENSGKTASSLIQYKSAVKRFIDIIDKDVLTIQADDLETYLNNNFSGGKTKENQSRYIKSFITFTIEKNMPKALKYTDGQLIMSLIPNEYRSLINVLLNK